MTRAHWRFLKKFSLTNLFVGTPRLSPQFGHTWLPYKRNRAYNSVSLEKMLVELLLRRDANEVAQRGPSGR
jgi:hypothetical protein